MIRLLFVFSTIFSSAVAITSPRSNASVETWAPPGLIQRFGTLQKRQGTWDFRDRNGNSFTTTDPNDPRVDWDLMPLSETKWNGIFSHGCSSALIQTWPDGSTPSPDLPAYLLTAGHCFAPFSQPEYRGKVYISTTQFSRTFVAGDTFDATSSDLSSFTMKVLHFATMNLTDLAIVELQESVASLRSRGFNFYKLAKEEFREGQSVEMVGYPAVGTGKRRYSKGVAMYREEIDESWGHHLSMTWRVDMNSFGGFSGSPVFLLGTNVTAGVFTQGGGRFGYANRAEHVHFCFNERGVFDFERRGCLNGWKRSWKKSFNTAWPGMCENESCVAQTTTVSSTKTSAPSSSTIKSNQSSRVGISLLMMSIGGVLSLLI